MKNYSDVLALIVDDSPVILSSIRRMLISLGLSDKNIYHAKDPKAAIWHCRKISFDLIICDYNFFTRLNGKQVFEELQHYGLIKPESSFVVITGESLSRVVRSIIELSPDEYILKPFNSLYFVTKIKKSLARKSALYKLYHAKTKMEYKKGLDLCDELEFSYPQYHYLIQKFRGEFYSLLHMFNEAKDLYDSIIVEKDVEWANAGLADSLIELGEFSRAQSVVEKMLDRVPNSTQALSLNAKYDIYNGDIPNAIKQFTMVSELTPGNPERELIIANLCMSQGDYRNAASRFMTYYDLNIDTYRDDLEARYNYIRCVLFLYDLTQTGFYKSSEEDFSDIDPRKLKSEALNEYRQIALLKEKKYDRNGETDAPVEDYDIEQELLMCHFSIIEGKLSEAISILKHLYLGNLVVGFYNRYHFLYLLNLLTFTKEFGEHIQLVRSDLDRVELSPMLLKSQVEMIKSLSSQHTILGELISQKLENAKTYRESGNMVEALDELMLVRSKNIYVRDVNTEIIHLLSSAWPSNYTGRDVSVLLKSCFKTSKELYTASDLKALGILDSLALAESRVAKFY
ncbi:response regulator [Vibrio aestuarianus]|uniref:response regulator n=1 Tax=Vibrio aestuarianus TaxID=28171 RepID=UPI001559B1E5|nr:response regulator [Vibrio aestuarianus]NGZ15640.1 response regulator [Vibrio aestuarianus]NKZ51788.1 response regulator [Vibrio aestuarianus]